MPEGAKVPFVGGLVVVRLHTVAKDHAGARNTQVWTARRAMTGTSSQKATSSQGQSCLRRMFLNSTHMGRPA